VRPSRQDSSGRDLRGAARQGTGETRSRSRGPHARSRKGRHAAMCVGQAAARSVEAHRGTRKVTCTSPVFDTMLREHLEEQQHTDYTETTTLDSTSARIYPEAGSNRGTTMRRSAL